MAGRKEAASARGRFASCFASAPAQKNSWETDRRGAPCVSRAQSGARAAPARYARPRRHRRAQDTRESGSRHRAGRRRGGWNGVERNGMEERHAGMRKRGPETPPPASWERAEAAAEKPPPPGRGLGEGPQAGKRKKGASDGGRQARPYDRTGDRICARSMPIMTFHDISQGVPPVRMTKHDIA